MVNVQKVKQKRFDAFKQGHLNNLISKYIKLSRRDEDGIVYEDISINGKVVAYFKYETGLASFVEVGDTECTSKT